MAEGIAITQVLLYSLVHAHCHWGRPYGMYVNYLCNAQKSNKHELVLLLEAGKRTGGTGFIQINQIKAPQESKTISEAERAASKRTNQLKISLVEWSASR